MAISDATNAVFMTTELLEQILIHVPMRDLLLAQRVCRKRKATINKSTALQQALFFTPIPPRDGWEYNDSGDWKDRLTPCVVTTSEANFTYDDCGELCHAVYPSGVLNPLLLGKRDYVFGDLIYSAAATEAGEYFEPTPLLEKLLDRHRRTEASWQRMLITQPPLRECAVLDFTCESVGMPRVVSPGGITVGYLVAAIEGFGHGSASEVIRRYGIAGFQSFGMLIPKDGYESAVKKGARMSE